MPKMSLMRSIASCVPKGKVKKLCALAEFSEEEERIILEHYCDKTSAENTAENMNISLDQINKRKEWIGYKLESFLSDNPNFFGFFETLNIAKSMTK